MILFCIDLIFFFMRNLFNLFFEKSVIKYNETVLDIIIEALIKLTNIAIIPTSSEFKKKQIPV